MPEWWDNYEASPNGCSHPRSPHGRCIWQECPKTSYTYRWLMSWWRNKETCNHKQPPSHDKDAQQVPKVRELEAEHQ